MKNSRRLRVKVRVRAILFYSELAPDNWTEKNKRRKCYVKNFSNAL